MTVSELKELEYEEYIGWLNYFERRPPNWQDDLRTYYIMSSGMGQLKQKPEEIFPSILAVKKDEEIEKEEGARLQSSLKSSPFGISLVKAGIN